MLRMSTLFIEKWIIRSLGSIGAPFIEFKSISVSVNNDFNSFILYMAVASF